MPELKLTLKRHPNNQKEIEQSIIHIKKLLASLKQSCENRSLDTFPVETVQEIFNKSEFIKKNVDDVQVPQAFFDAIMDTKDLLSYTKDRIENLRREENDFKEKRMCFLKFHEMLEELRIAKFQ